MKCARCDRKVKVGEAVYSPARKLHYCGPAKWKRCDELFKKKQAQGG